MKLVLITGFLGAGKTTLLQNLLKEYAGTKMGVLMNEFGEVSIDGKLISTQDFDLIELTNGSIFCACLKENFIKGLAEFLNYDLETVFIESSGVADPSNMQTILETTTKIAQKSYDYRGSICIADGLYFLDQLDLIPALERQVFYANAVIVNKSDLQEPDVLKEIEAKITAINSAAEIFRTSFCEVPVRALVETMGGAKQIADKETGNTWESRLKTSVLRTTATLNMQQLRLFLDEIKSSAHRIKGFVQTDQGNFEISCVNNFAVMNSWNESVSETEIVIISSVGIRIISEFHRLWEKYFAGISCEIR